MNNLQVLVLSLGKRVHCATRQGFAHLREAAHLRSRQPAAAAAADDQAEGPVPTVDAAAADEAEVKDHLTEKGISSQLLRLSVFVIAVKSLHYLFDRKWLLALDSGFNSVLAAPFWLWAFIMSLTSAFVPIVCGVAMAVVTWYTVFLDTCIPGVYPPTAAPAKKLWFSLPSTFHLGYVTTFVNVFILSILIYQGYNNSMKM